ncbi:MAG: hypothetical protein QXN71_02225 [Candidatus Aenigmatarchaeota archaeon]
MAEGQLIEKELQEAKKKLEQLEKEKAELTEKSKSLAEIIETLSDNKPDTGNIESVLKEIGERFDAKIKKLEESIAASGKDKDEVKKQVAAAMKEKIDPKIAEISERLKELDKIKDIGEKVMQLNERLSSPLYQPKQPGVVSQGLAAFGEQIDFQTELTEVKRSIDTLNQTIATMSKKVEYRLSSLEDKVKELEKLKELETQYREINDKLGAENIQKLKKIIFSADELMEEAIPETVNRKIKKRIEPIVNSLKSSRDMISELEKRAGSLEDEVKELKKFRETINELRAEKEKAYKKFAEEEARFLQGLEILKMNIRKRMEKMMEKYHEQLVKMQQYTTPKVLESNVKDIVVELFEPRFQELEKHNMIVDEKLRTLSEKDREILETVEEMEAPENLRRWIDEKSKNLERKFYYDIQGLKKSSERNSDQIASLREKQKSTDSFMAELSKKMSDQAATINKVIDVRDVFSKRAEILSSSIKSIEQRMAADRERIVLLEQNLRDAESRFDDVSENVASLQRSIAEIKSLRERISQADASLKAIQKKLAEKEGLSAQVRKMDSEISSLKERQSKLESQLASDRARLESEIRQVSLERKSVEEKIKRERMRISGLLRELKAE